MSDTFNTTFKQLLDENERLIKTLRRLEAEIRLLKLDNDKMRKLLGIYK